MVTDTHLYPQQVFRKAPDTHLHFFDHWRLPATCQNMSLFPLDSEDDAALSQYSNCHCLSLHPGLQGQPADTQSTGTVLLPTDDHQTHQILQDLKQTPCWRDLMCFSKHGAGVPLPGLWFLHSLASVPDRDASNPSQTHPTQQQHHLLSSAPPQPRPSRRRLGRHKQWFPPQQLPLRAVVLAWCGFLNEFGSKTSYSKCFQVELPHMCMHSPTPAPWKLSQESSPIHLNFFGNRTPDHVITFHIKNTKGVFRRGTISTVAEGSFDLSQQLQRMPTWTLNEA